MQTVYIHLSQLAEVAYIPALGFEWCCGAAGQAEQGSEGSAHLGDYPWRISCMTALISVARSLAALERGQAMQTHILSRRLRMQKGRAQSWDLES